MIRKPANFVSTITDERGGELVYAGLTSFLCGNLMCAGMKITDIFKEDVGVGGVVSLLWLLAVFLFVLIHPGSRDCCHRMRASSLRCVS